MAKKKHFEIVDGRQTTDEVWMTAGQTTRHSRSSSGPFGLDELKHVYLEDFRKRPRIKVCEFCDEGSHKCSKDKYLLVIFECNV